METISELFALLNWYSVKYGAGLIYGILIGCLALIIFICFMVFRKINKVLIKRNVCRFFELSDLDNFDVRKMGRPGTKYYREDGVNSFNLALPHWKYMLEDGSKDKSKLFNKVVWEKSILWLHAGRKVYVVYTKDPWDMVCLVHILRESGLDISPCQQELDKQETLEQQKNSCNKVIYNVVQSVAGDKQQFVDLCRERLSVWGYKVADAPQNTCDIDLFIQKNNKPSIVRCLLTFQGQLINLEDLQSLKKDAEQFFADSCMLITTGSVTVAAAGYAREHNIEIICGEQLVELLEKDSSVIGRDYLNWEMTEKDINSLLDEECLNYIFR